jgi:hypothetical protein
MAAVLDELCGRAEARGLLPRLTADAKRSAIALLLVELQSGSAKMNAASLKATAISLLEAVGAGDRSQPLGRRSP